MLGLAFQTIFAVSTSQISTDCHLKKGSEVLSTKLKKIYFTFDQTFVIFRVFENYEFGFFILKNLINYSMGIGGSWNFLGLSTSTKYSLIVHFLKKMIKKFV